MYDIRHHELMISYLHKRLAEMPHGSFGMCRGVPVVYVTYDPMDPQIHNGKIKRYRIDSTEGKLWSPVISEYINIRDQLKELLNAWHLLYRIEPREIKYPLIKKTKSILTEEFFYDAAEYANPQPIEHPIEYKGRVLRSKNELLGCRTAEKFGLQYKIEIAIGNDPFEMLYPDITFLVPYQQRCIAAEINGALDNIRYANKSLNRQSIYIGNGLMISKDVIFLDIADRSQFYTELFETQIRSAILAGLDDIVFPHGYYDDIQSLFSDVYHKNGFNLF